MPNPWARLGPLNIDDGEDYIFVFAQSANAVSQLAPNDMQRRYSAILVPVPIAQADHLPEEWKGNNPGEITFEHEIIAPKNLDISRSLRRLRKFMRKDRRTGEPPLLVFVMGQRQWTCRMVSLLEHPKLWSEDTAELRARISITRHTTKWED
jgi:hypothetical protein